MKATFFLVLVIASNASGAAPAEELTQAAAKSPCCASLSLLPERRALHLEQSLSLEPSSPHFDFGWGVTPFAVYSIDPNTVRVVELQAEGRFSFASFSRSFPASKVIFFDSEWNAIAFEPLSTPHLKEVGFAKSQVLADRVGVPENAVAMVIAADVRRVGSRAQSIQSQSSSTYAAAGMVMRSGGGVGVVEYDLTVYGTYDILSFAPRR